MKEKLLIIDGHNLLFQMFYGMPNKIYNKNNIPVHGVIGFVGALLKIVKFNNPNYIVILFDKEQEIQRQSVNKEYKGNRIDYSKVPFDENPFSQLENIYKVLDGLNIKHTEVQTVETDDIIASYCFRYMEEYDIVISSFDTDFYSLINDSVKVFRYRGKNSQIIDAQFVKCKFNIESKYFADYKALIGDASDNIKGVSGIGPKTAAFLINKYGDIENIIFHIDELKNANLRKKIVENVELLRENITLIKYINEYVLPFNIDELKINFSKDEKTMDLLKKTGIMWFFIEQSNKLKLIIDDNNIND